MSAETSVRIEVMPDIDPDASYLEQAGFEDRLQAYRNDEFGFVGVRVAVEAHDWDTGVTVRTTSAGLWGIESDSGDEYFREVAADEANALEGVSIEGAAIVWVNA